MSLLERILNEVAKNLNFFSIENDFNMERYKKFTELSMYFEICSSNELLHKNEQLKLVKDFINEQLNLLTADTMFKNPYLAYHIITPYTHFRKINKIERFEKYLNLICEYEFFPPEVPPHREMEWGFLKYKIGIEQNVKIPKSCILHKKILMTHFDRDHAYALTHALIYASDFGFMKSKPPVKDIAQLKFVLECLMIKFYGEDDIDVLLELGINYFGLFQFEQINCEMLNVIDICLNKDNFIEFDWTTDEVEAKYHSLLLIGILGCQIQMHLQCKNASITKLKKLSTAFENSVFGKLANEAFGCEKDNTITTMKEYQTWKIISSLSKKDFDIQHYRNYLETFDKNLNLEAEIIYYLRILQKRNEGNYLWEREFEFLKLDEQKQEKLKKEYSTKIIDSLEVINKI